MSMIVFLSPRPIFELMQLTIQIPDAALRAMRMPADQIEAELKKELALVLYSREVLSAGKATEMAGISRLEFEALLAERRIERPFSIEELERDLSWAKSQT
jgi:predicted HTH domain antitoxin